MFREGFFFFLFACLLWARSKCRSISYKYQFAKIKGTKNNGVKKTILITDWSTAYIQNTQRENRSEEQKTKMHRQKQFGNIDAFTKTTQQIDVKAFKLPLIWHGFNLSIISFCALFVWALCNSSVFLAPNSFFSNSENDIHSWRKRI